MAPKSTPYTCKQPCGWDHLQNVQNENRTWRTPTFKVQEEQEDTEKMSFW
jgi:hypothetical protein